MSDDLTASRERFVSAGREAVGAVTRRDSELWPGTVSHYCDAAGLIGIVANRELWASDLQFMNDATEISWTREAILSHCGRWIEARCKELQLPSSALLPLLDGVRNRIRERLSRGQIYAVCFCEDGDLLSQWRGYGSFGGGYSLALSTAGLSSLVERAPLLSFSRVVYDQEVALGRAHDAITAAMRHFKEGIEERGLPIPAMSHITSDLVSASVVDVVCSTKHPAFAEEREWRLIYRPDVQWAAARLAREFRPTIRGVTPFVRIRTDSTSESVTSIEGLPLNYVTTGPTATPDLAVKAARELLIDHGFPYVEVHLSSIPLRG